MGSVSLSGCLAARQRFAEFEGHTSVFRATLWAAIDLTLLRAHAALSPWEGRNALDAAIASYNSISALRQQLKLTHRIHGIFEGQDWAPNSRSFHSYHRALLIHIASSYPGQSQIHVRYVLPLCVHSWIIDFATVALFVLLHARRWQRRQRGSILVSSV